MYVLNKGFVILSLFYVDPQFLLSLQHQTQSGVLQVVPEGQAEHGVPDL